jgi:hypothetical protein
MSDISINQSIRSDKDEKVSVQIRFRLISDLIDWTAALIANA